MNINEFYLKIGKKYNIITDSSFRDQVNFQKHKELPIHRWLKYREGYSVELVNRIIEELHIKGPILDPFLGSGTTTFSSALKKIKSCGIEINPFPAFVSKVKTRKYNKKFIKEFEKILPSLLIESEPCIKPELKILDNAFGKDELKKLLIIKNNIFNINKQRKRDLAFFIWLSVLEESSNTFKEGNGIKYRGKFGYKRQPRKGSSSYDEYLLKLEKYKNEGWCLKDVNKIFTKRFSEVISDLKKIDYNNWKEPEIMLGDAKDITKLLVDRKIKEVELTVFSPPYANCFDYFEIFKIELWMGGFIKSYDDLKIERQKGLISNLNTNLKDINYFNDDLDFLINNIDRSKLWDVKIIDMLKGYFRDMSDVLNEIWKVTKKDGYVVIIVANSSYGDVIIPTDIILSKIGEKIGFKVKKIVEARRTNTSSQQMKRYKELEIDTSLLRESLVYFQKT